MKRRRYDPGPDCKICGLKQINVVHEQDPEHSAEGAAYHAEFAHHRFEPDFGVVIDVTELA